MSDKKKVLVLTTTFPRWKNDTVPAFVYELSKRLQKDGFEIIVLAPHSYGAKKFEIMDEMKIYRFPYFYPYKYQTLAYGGGILPSIKRSHLAKIQIPLLFLSELYYAFKIIEKEKIDIIHSHWIIPSGFIGGICKKILMKRHILSEHAAGLAALEKLPFKNGIANFIFENSDNITVVSSYIKERLINEINLNKNGIKNNIEIIPMGVDTTIFNLNINKNELKEKYGIRTENVLIFIGRIAEKKGLSYLIDAMPKIISKNSDIMLLACGDGPLRKECEKLVERLNLEKFVRFTGFITNTEKVEYLSLSDILIVPSVVAQSGDTEGLPVVLLEGLASGKPVIASNVGGMNDAIKEDNGILIEQKSSEQIAEKVLELIDDKELMKNFGNHALMTSKNYDWEVIKSKFHDIIIE